MCKKLAITISGAVSLGSYEAGVAFEVLDAIAQHNTWADKNGTPEERIEVDVLSGASAGGMTVAMIAQRLLYDGAAMSQPYNNPLFNAWVTDIDILDLLARGDKEDVTHSVFSSDLVIKISERYLTARYATEPPAQATPHPALPLNNELKLGLALSNLNGVDYTRATMTSVTGKSTATGAVTSSGFTYTRFEDEFLCPIASASDDRGDFWERIRAMAVACGAFPIAFRVQDLLRNISEFTSPFLNRCIWNGQQARYFTYTDGGAFQNEPLGMAKNLVETLPGGHLDAENRGYVFISPHPKTSLQVPFTANPEDDPATAFGSANANYKAVILRLAGAVIGQSEFQDWVMAEQVNEKILSLDQRADQLLDLFLTGKLKPVSTTPISDALLDGLFKQDQKMNAMELEVKIKTARVQLKEQYATEYAKFGKKTGVAAAWLDSVLVLEMAAGLHEKEVMQIYDFTAPLNWLAGAGMQSFEGFFDVRYRKHDYDCGRNIAQERLKQYSSQAKGIFSNLHWSPRQIDPIDTHFDNFKMSDVSQSKRKKVYAQLRDAANELLTELDVPGPIRIAAMWFFVDGKIKAMLEL